MAAIKQLVFDEKRCTGAELLEAVKHNWKGYEKLYALVNSSKVHHYGNDDDYADELFKFMFETYCKHIAGRKTPRGGIFSPGVYSVNANVAMGLNTDVYKRQKEMPAKLEPSIMAQAASSSWRLATKRRRLPPMSSMAFSAMASENGVALRET